MRFLVDANLPRAAVALLAKLGRQVEFARYGGGFEPRWAHPNKLVMEPSPGTAFSSVRVLCAPSDGRAT